MSEVCIHQSNVISSGVNAADQDLLWMVFLV